MILCNDAGDTRSAGQPGANNCCSSTESTPRTRPRGETNDQRNHGSSLRGNSFHCIKFDIYNYLNQKEICSNCLRMFKKVLSPIYGY